MIDDEKVVADFEPPCLGSGWKRFAATGLAKGEGENPSERNRSSGRRRKGVGQMINVDKRDAYEDDYARDTDGLELEDVECIGRDWSKVGFKVGVVLSLPMCRLSF
ncbi:hypothetical protein ZHAS_00012399 [Anopheles sinensis]|uniref:Uncharacterized protein n=1 Tax=Anopheles sinensis TaxID=74873 RepID=A0A084W2S7_ANOSI|nr:hypothetical protein ZHAS_00012399 [Anopheles sinensis]